LASAGRQHLGDQHLASPGAPIPISDGRPIIMTDGLVKSRDHLALPIGPRSLFVATNTEKSENLIRSMDPRDLMQQVNDRVASQARRYVYGTDEGQLRFVANRLGRQNPSTPLEAREESRTQTR
jgi:hypothetical protein